MADCRRVDPKRHVCERGRFAKHRACDTERRRNEACASDSFVGGMMGYLASRGNFESKTLKEALAYGTIVASFNVEDFSLDRMKQIERADLDKRLVEYRQMLSF